MPDFVEINDFLSRSSTLRTHGRREAFNPANLHHLASLKKFLETGSWGDVMFFVEFPFTDVPTYVLTKYASHMLGATRKTNSERAASASGTREPRESLMEIAARNLAKGELLEPNEDPVQ